MMTLEDADLCVKRARIGCVRLARRAVVTSDRRIAAQGRVRARRIYFKAGLLWMLGMRRAADRRCPDVR